jgi:hypothetical protein
VQQMVEQVVLPCITALIPNFFNIVIDVCTGKNSDVELVLGELATSGEAMKEEEDSGHDRASTRSS